jgi:hypothetical protein
MNLFNLNDALKQYPFFVNIVPEDAPHEVPIRERLMRVDRSEDGLYTIEIERPMDEYTCFKQIFPRDNTAWQKITRDPFTDNLCFNPKEPYYMVKDFVPSLIE